MEPLSTFHVAATLPLQQRLAESTASNKKIIPLGEGPSDIMSLERFCANHHPCRSRWRFLAAEPANSVGSMFASQPLVLTPPLMRASFLLDCARNGRQRCVFLLGILTTSLPLCLHFPPSLPLCHHSHLPTRPGDWQPPTTLLQRWAMLFLDLHWSTWPDQRLPYSPSTKFFFKILWELTTLKRCSTPTKTSCIPMSCSSTLCMVPTEDPLRK